MITTGKLLNVSLDYFRGPELLALIEINANPEDLERLKNKKLSIEIKQYRQKRSLDANAYYRQLVTKMMDVLTRSMSYIHNDMLRKYGQIELVGGSPVYLVIPDTEEAEKVVNESERYHLKPTSQVKTGTDGIDYRTYMMLRGSHTYDTKEMSTLINGTMEEAKDLGIETMTPEQLEEMMVLYEQHYAERHK